MRKKKEKIICVRLPMELYQQLELASALLGFTVSDLMRYIAVDTVRQILSFPQNKRAN